MPKPPVPKPTEPKIAIGHATDGGSKHAVVVNDLRVMLLKDGESWFAQGLELDYASAGATVDEAKKNFEVGFAKTVREHLVMYGNLSKFIQVAPQETWQEFFNAPPETKHMVMSSVQVHDLVEESDLDVKLPFGNILFIQQVASEKVAR